MKREQRLAHIARELYETVQDEKAIKKHREEMRQEFFRLHDAGFSTNHILPVRTVEVPEAFFKKTKLTQEEFVTRRFPGWEVEHVELNTVTAIRTFVLKRDIKYIAGVVDIEDEGQTVRVSKEVVEYTPTVDFETLKKERPDLYKKLKKTVKLDTLDEEKFEALLAEHPEELSVVERHLVVKEPALRATAKKVKDEE